MALAFLNRCGFRATSNGTGDFVVASALTGMYAPASCANPAVVDEAVYRYFAESDDKTQHEEGFGAWNSGTGTLARTVILSSTNSGSAVNFSAAPKVFMGGPLAQDKTLDLIVSYDITNDGPFTNLDFPLDFTTYESFVVMVNALEIEFPASPAISDYITSNFTALDAGGTPIAPSPNESSFPAPLQTYDGANWTGDQLYRFFGSVAVAPNGAAMGGNCATGTVTDYVWTGSGNFYTSRQGEVGFDSPPQTVSAIRISALFWDDSLGDYGPQPDFDGGTIAMYGVRRQ